MRSVSRWVGAAALVAMTAGGAGAQTHTFTTTLTGSQEVPPNGSAATGFATLVLNTTANTLSVNMTFSGLTANVTGAHLHCCAPPGAVAPVAVDFGGVNGFPLGGTGGSYIRLFDLLSSTTYAAGFLNTNAGGSVLTARNLVVNGMLNGQTYVKLHNQPFPGGEIRGNIAAVIPEPSTYVLMASGLAGLGMIARRRRVS
jgi:hypothetical protein